jgi:hypothetical protein
MRVGKRIIDGPHGLDVAVRTGTPVRSIDDASHVEFGFRQISDSGITPLETGETRNKKEDNPYTHKTQPSDSSRPRILGSHESSQTNLKLWTFYYRP